MDAFGLTGLNGTLGVRVGHCDLILFGLKASNFTAAAASLSVEFQSVVHT